jgi:hypothetical protein
VPVTHYVVEVKERTRPTRWFGEAAGAGWTDRESAVAGAEALHANPIKGYSEACKTVIVPIAEGESFGHTILALGE